MDYEFSDTLTISKDEAERKAKTGKSVTVLFKFKDWSDQDLVNRLAVANSPKVSVATILRNMKDIPSTYTYEVPKAGTRAIQNPETAARTMTLEQLQKIVAEKEAELKAKVIVRPGPRTGHETK